MPSPPSKRPVSPNTPRVSTRPLESLPSARPMQTTARRLGSPEQGSANEEQTPRHPRAGFFVAGALLACVIALAAFPALALKAPTEAGLYRIGAFLGSIAALTLLMMAIGISITGQKMGMLWNARNTYSLSRLQIALWTLMALSALAATAACRAFGLFTGDADGVATALDIHIPAELLQAMGISLLSGALAPAILSMKSHASVSQRSLDAATSRVGGTVAAAGSLVVRPDGCPPLLRDLFQSDDVSAAGTVDVSKVQQFVITLILITTYLVMLLHMFWTGNAVDKDVPATISALPPLSPTFVYWLGISHLGYLAYKAAPAPTTTAGRARADTQGTTDASALSRSLPRPMPPSIG